MESKYMCIYNTTPAGRYSFTSLQTTESLTHLCVLFNYLVTISKTIFTSRGNIVTLCLVPLSGGDASVSQLRSGYGTNIRKRGSTYLSTSLSSIISLSVFLSLWTHTHTHIFTYQKWILQFLFAAVGLFGDFCIFMYMLRTCCVPSYPILLVVVLVVHTEMTARWTIALFSTDQTRCPTEALVA